MINIFANPKKNPKIMRERSGNTTCNKDNADKNIQ